MKSSFSLILLVILMMGSSSYAIEADCEKALTFLDIRDAHGASLDSLGNEARYEALMVGGGGPILKFEDLERAISRLEISAELKAGLRGMLPRTRAHLTRLLRPLTGSPAEKTFAIAMIQYGPKKLKTFESDYQTRRNLLSTTDGETYNTQIWWTLSPYIFKYLVAKGMTPQGAVERLIDWAAKNENDEDQEVATLPGIWDFFRGYRIYHYYLEVADSNHVTHRFSDQEAKKLVETEPFFHIP